MKDDDCSDSQTPQALTRDNASMPLPRSGLRGWLTMGIYQPLFLLVFLVYAPVLLWRLAFARSASRKGMGERMGFVPKRAGDRPLIWIHGVSVGEVKAASNFVAKLQAARPEES
jgi:3-deoxy-D-manno-octulosonic-acid transferase